MVLVISTAHGERTGTLSVFLMKPQVLRSRHRKLPSSNGLRKTFNCSKNAGALCTLKLFGTISKLRKETYTVPPSPLSAYQETSWRDYTGSISNGGNGIESW